MTIRMDMIESGSTIMGCKMLGWIPATHEPDEFNLYVRTVGSTVIVSRSDTDEKIVSAVGFNNAMVALANYYSLPVVVSHELDHGYAPTKKSKELMGHYEPTVEPITERGLSDGTRVKVGDILVVPAIPGTQPVEIVTFLPRRTIVRYLVTGELECRDYVEYFHGEIVYRAGDVRVVPVIGDRYRNTDTGNIMTVTGVDADTFTFNGSTMNILSLTTWVEGGTLVKVAGGAGSADEQPFRTAGKHKNTRARRARRGGAR